MWDWDFVTKTRNTWRCNTVTHLDESLELLRDADNEEPGDEAELGLGQGPLTAGLPALGRHPTEEWDLEHEKNQH